MAKQTKSAPQTIMVRTAAPVARKGSTGVSKKRFEAAVARAKSAGKRAIAARTSPLATVVTAGAGYAFGMLEKRGTELPTVAGIMPAALYGVGLAVAGHTVAKNGRVGEALRQAGAGALAVAGYKLGTGQPFKVGEDWTDE